MHWRHFSHGKLRNMSSPLLLLSVLFSPQQKGSFLQLLQSEGILLWSLSVTVWLINTKYQHRSVKSLPCCMTLTSLFPSCQSPAFSTLPCLQASKSLTASAVPKHFFKCSFPLWQLYLVSPCLSCCPLGRGINSGSHTPAHTPGGREEDKIIPEDSPGCPPLSG